MKKKFQHRWVMSITCVAINFGDNSVSYREIQSFTCENGTFEATQRGFLWENTRNDSSSMGWERRYTTEWPHIYDDVLRGFKKKKGTRNEAANLYTRRDRKEKHFRRHTSKSPTGVIEIPPPP